MTGLHRPITASLLAVALAAGAFVGTGPASATGAPVGLELFVHPGHGGGWSSHALAGIAAGSSAPSIGAVGDRLVLAELDASGDVTVAEGTLFGAFAPDDLSATIGAPQAAGPPVVTTARNGTVSVWYRSTTDDLEVATQASASAAWSVTDVTWATGGAPLLGDPFVSPSGLAYAVVANGTVDEFVPPSASSGSWTQSDPTDGLVYPPFAGDVAVFAAPGAPAATVILGAAADGDVVELSDELPAPFEAVGPWRYADLSSLGAPGADGPISAIGGSVGSATYDSWGSVVALKLTSGLPGGFIVDDLSYTDVLWPSSPFAPTLVRTPNGPMVADPATTGDLLLTGISPTPRVDDISFEPRTGELVASSVASTNVGRAVALVAAVAGPIAPSPQRRHIALLATSYDQEHAGYTTDPTGSDCNKFTAAFGRGSTYGCPAGTSSEEWCSDFADFVWTHAGVPTGGITGWAATFITWGRRHHRVQMGTHFRAAVGDAIVWGTRSPLYGTHVAIIVSVQGTTISVISGNSPVSFPGDPNWGVWRWGTFDGRTSTVNGYPVLGVVSP